MLSTDIYQNVPNSLTLRNIHFEKKLNEFKLFRRLIIIEYLRFPQVLTTKYYENGIFQ
jgi:hypothetical protein